MIRSLDQPTPEVIHRPHLCQSVYPRANPLIVTRRTRTSKCLRLDITTRGMPSITTVPLSPTGLGCLREGASFCSLDTRTAECGHCFVGCRLIEVLENLSVRRKGRRGWRRRGPVTHGSCQHHRRATTEMELMSLAYWRTKLPKLPAAPKIAMEDESWIEIMIGKRPPPAQVKCQLTDGFLRSHSAPLQSLAHRHDSTHPLSRSCQVTVCRQSIGSIGRDNGVRLELMVTAICRGIL